MFKLIVLIIGAVMPMPVFADEVSRDVYATALAQDLFCSAMQLFSGDIGLLIGLALSAAGFAFVLFRGLAMGYIVMILAGIFMTAIPGWFQSSINAYSTITSSIRPGQDVNKIIVHESLWKNSGCNRADSMTPKPLETDLGHTEGDGHDHGYSGPGVGTIEGGGVLDHDAVITSAYGKIRNGKLHTGVDIRAPIGTSVYSPVTGTVTRSYYSNSYGNAVFITDSNGNVHEFGHLSGRNVQTGATITAGQQLGRSGDTGSPGQPHLHYTVRNSSGNHTNPCSSFITCS